MRKIILSAIFLLSVLFSFAQVRVITQVTYPIDTSKTEAKVISVNGQKGIVTVSGTDTASLSNRINLKVNSIDTIRFLHGSDTVSLSNRINTKLTSSDTTSLSNRINLKRDTAGTLPIYNGGTNNSAFVSGFLLHYSPSNLRVDTASQLFYNQTSLGLGISPTIADGLTRTFHLHNGGAHFTSTASGTTTTDGSDIYHHSDNALYIKNLENGNTYFYNNGVSQMTIQPTLITLSNLVSVNQSLANADNYIAGRNSSATSLAKFSIYLGNSGSSVDAGIDRNSTTNTTNRSGVASSLNIFNSVGIYFLTASTLRGNISTFGKWTISDSLAVSESANVDGTLTTDTLKVLGSVNNDGGGLKHARVTTGSVSAGSTALVTVTWTSAFADDNYTAFSEVEDATASSLSLSVVHIEEKTASQLKVRVLNNAVGALTGTLHVIAIHD